jgi:NDP-4-keto-2,6-dideoxyhexose 3-C-methyltransferase
MINAITQCRICKNTDLEPIIHLGEQALTGLFPRSINENVTKGPLELVRCRKSSNGCGLLQLKHSYEASELYGDHYGYRSSLNQSMVHHLKDIVEKALKRIAIKSNDIVLDIGSNDSTLLRSYPTPARLVGMDPGGNKFKKYYPAHIELIADFFSSKAFQAKFGTQKAKIITSIAMFYDLPDPMGFMKDISEILAGDGIWIFEQSYMPTMLKGAMYDTICHEHFEYYGLDQIKWMTDRTGFKIIDVDFNDTNGGSFRITVAKVANKNFQENAPLIAKILEEEAHLDKGSFQDFTREVEKSRAQLIEFLSQVKKDKKTILGYGASTKGNVILQYCGFTPKDIPFIAEVNEDKYGHVTPGTGISIISEAQAKAMKPDYLLVLPWHFKDNIIEREKSYLEAGGTLVFPLPEITQYSLTKKTAVKV